MPGLTQTIEQLAELVTTAGEDWGAEKSRGPRSHLQIVQCRGEFWIRPWNSLSPTRSCGLTLADEAEQGVAPVPECE